MSVLRLPQSRNVSVAFQDTPALDGFGRLRVGSPDTLLESTGEYGRSTLFWFHYTSGAASTSAHVNNESCVRLTCGTEINAYSVRQTKEYFHYQPNKSQFIVATFVFGAAVAGVDRQVGYFDDDNGLFLEQHGTVDLAVVRRTKVTGVVIDNRVLKANWNLDTLDGSGNAGNPSGISLDLSKAQHLVIDLQFLGVGRARIGFRINDAIYYVHKFTSANILSTVYMTTACLPIRYRIANTTVQGGNHTMDCICSAVESEAGVTQGLGYHFSANNGITSIAVTTRRAILSIRPKATFGPSARVVRGFIRPHEVELIAGTNNAFYEIVYMPTFTTGGGALTWTSADAESIVEFCVHGDANAGAITGGSIVESGYVASGAGAARNTLAADLASKLPLVLDQAGANPIALSIVVTSMTGTSNVAASMNWEEQR